jgi:hypothetical protein
MYPRKSSILCVSTSFLLLEPQNQREEAIMWSHFPLENLCLHPVLIVTSLGGSEVIRGGFNIERSFLRKRRA